MCRRRAVLLSHTRPGHAGRTAGRLPAKAAFLIDNKWTML